MNKLSLTKRYQSMLKVDFKRMFSTPLVYIMFGISLVVPILILIMTSMLSGTSSVDPSTGEVTSISGFTNVWQTIGSLSTDSSAMSMDLTSMCNINLLYFLAVIFVCCFVANDFRSGYVKNLFTVRAKKSDYVFSKTLVGFIACAFMIVFYFIGALIGGGIAGLSFDVGSAGVGGIIMCLISKIFLMVLFVSLAVLMSTIGKQRLWLSIIISLCVCMLLFTMIPMMTPLDSNFLNVIMCLVGGVLFAIGLGVVSNLILSKTNLV